MTKYTTYKEAVSQQRVILCNNIPEVDPSVWDNMRFSLFDEDGNQIEIFQWYLTSADTDEVEYTEKRYGLLYTYSDKLDLFVLCVAHFGTSWDGVNIEDHLVEIDENGNLVRVE